MKFLIDEGVPHSVGRVLQDAGHEVVFFEKSGLPKGSEDPLVCAAAESSEAVLVAADSDMKTLARGHGIKPARFKTLSLLRFECKKPQAAERMKLALSLVEHEWEHRNPEGRQFYVVIGEASIRTHR